MAVRVSEMGTRIMQEDARIRQDGRMGTRIKEMTARV
jgi:hypothetical protein